MAIYRPAKPRLPAIAGAALLGLIVGLATGYLLGGAGRSDPAAAADELARSLRDAAVPLAVIETEYRQGVRGGRVVNQDGYAGARAAVVSSRRRFEQARSALEALAPQRASAIGRTYSSLGRLIAGRAAPVRVAKTVATLRAKLEP